MAKAALVVAAMLLLVACEPPTRSAATEAPSPAPPGGVIPWTPLQPNLTPPAPSLGPAPIPPGTPPCQATDLVGTVIGSNGAAGHVITTIRFTGVGPLSCYVDGTPSVGLLDSKGNVISIRQQAPYLPTRQPGRMLVEPGPVASPHTAVNHGQADLTIDWWSQPDACPINQPLVPVEAVVAAPGGGIVGVAIPNEPAAYGCQGLGVGAFEGPYVSIQPRPPPALPAISLQVPSTARVGHDLPYLVALTNDRGQPLDLTAACPTYEEELFIDLVNSSPPPGGKHIFALNCQPAGTIAPGASVTFQMVFLQIPPDATPGKYTLVFMLGYYNAMTSFSQVPVTLGT